MLDNLSDQQLKDELERRRQSRNVKKPKAIANPDYSSVNSLCRDYIDNLDSQKYDGGDLKQYIFEAAMAAVFGNTVWKYIRAKMR